MTDVVRKRSGRRTVGAKGKAAAFASHFRIWICSIASKSEAPPVKRTVLLRGIPLLKFYRTDIARVRMRSTSIVKHFDKINCSSLI